MYRTAALLACTAAFSVAAEDWKSQGILHLDQSPHAKLRSVPVRAVTLADGFWSERRRVNVQKSIPSLLALLEENAIVDNFRRLSGRRQTPRKGPLYTDSDLYKWMEAAAFVLQSENRPELRKIFESLIGDVLAAQRPDGYLNTYYVDERAGQRHTNMQHGHELYCLGHLLQAGIAYYRATGERRLLDGGLRMVDYLLANFGPDKKPLFEGHPEIELALVEVYRTTGQRRYLDLAGYLLKSDPRLKVADRDLVYLFTGKSFTSRTIMEGHSVRASYASSGATDYYIETGDSAFIRTLENLWQDMTGRKMYITGGIGSRAQGEAFGEPYELPNLLAYTESCAAIGNLIWNWRMLAATGQARFADVMERALYNGVNSGMSVSGTLYCYRNPLELVGNPADKIRNPWYTTTCCPPNLERILASLPGYFYSTSKEGVYVHLFHSGELNWKLDDGTPLKIRQVTKYPWEGEVEITVDPAQPREFTLFVRVPAWAEGAKLTVNGQPAARRAAEYAAVRRMWRSGDRIRLQLPMQARTTSANPLVRENVGRVAIERGPLVYCLEGLDQPAPDLNAAVVTANPFAPEFRPDLLGGAVVLKHKGAAYVRPLEGLSLYGMPSRLPAMGDADLTFIPYYLFANREATPMQVWVPVANRAGAAARTR
jgi:uncharacterized protein